MDRGNAPEAVRRSDAHAKAQRPVKGHSFHAVTVPAGDVLVSRILKRVQAIGTETTKGPLDSRLAVRELVARLRPIRCRHRLCRHQ